MLRYILRRLLQALPVFLGTTFLIYALVFAMPGDPVLALFGERTPNPAQLESLRAHYNLDKPFIVQYLLYLQGIVTGNMGETFSGRSVSDVLHAAMPVTVKLVIMAVLMEFVLSVVIGMISGLLARKAAIVDYINLIIALVLNSVPVFVAMFFAQYWIGIRRGWAPVTVGGNATWGAMFLPALVIALTIYVTGMRLMRGTVVESQHEDYVRTAYAKGLRPSRVIPVHILRNSLIPVVTNSAASFGYLIASTTVTEAIWDIPGVGNTLYQAILRGEGPTVVSFVTVLTVAYVVLNILVDLLYAVLDPRIHYV